MNLIMFNQDANLNPWLSYNTPTVISSTRADVKNQENNFKVFTAMATTQADIMTFMPKNSMIAKNFQEMRAT